MIRTIIFILAVPGAWLSATVLGGDSPITWLMITLFFGMSYWVFRDQTLEMRAYKKLTTSTPFQQFIVEQHCAHQAELEKEGGENVIPLKVDSTLDLRRRPPYPHHTVRIIRAIERAADGDVIKVVGDGQLTMEHLKIGCQFTDTVLKGWRTDESGYVVGYIYKVPAARLSGEYEERVERALATMEIPQDDAELEKFLWNVIRKNPTYSSYDSETNGAA